MKKFMLGFLFLSLCAVLLANDTYFVLAGGTLTPTTASMTGVEMEREEIAVALYDGYYEITVDFSFYNRGAALTMPVGFPFFKQGTHGSGKIYDFVTWINGEKTDYASHPIDEQWERETGLSYAYVKTVTFPSHQRTATKVSYKAAYGAEAPSNLRAVYLYGSGTSWASRIGEIVIRVSNYSSSWIYSLAMPGENFDGAIQWQDGSTFMTTVKNIEPEYTDCIEIQLCRPFFDTGPKAFPRSFYYDEIEIPQLTLDLLREDQLRLLRNWFYALHGYRFKSTDLINIFSREKWYSLNDTFTESQLSDMERANIEKILITERALRGALK
ncbi:MAG: YARHG domain-containing protein [Treponema sp.]|nr:YARHG domain-containing protein [Treponema sp.]